MFDNNQITEVCSVFVFACVVCILLGQQVSIILWDSIK